MMKHGQHGEPWEAHGEYAILAFDNQLVAGPVEHAPRGRAIACVNALDGMDPEKLGEVATWARRLCNAIRQQTAGDGPAPISIAVQSRLRELESALAALETPVTETNHEEIGSSGQPTCGDLAAEAQEPGPEPEGIMCECCDRFFTDEAHQITHLEGVVRLVRVQRGELVAELAEAKAELELARRSVIRRDTHLAKVIAELREAKIQEQLADGRMERVDAELAAAKAELAEDRKHRVEFTRGVHRWAASICEDITNKIADYENDSRTKSGATTDGE